MHRHVGPSDVYKAAPGNEPWNADALCVASGALPQVPNTGEYPGKDGKCAALCFALRSLRQTARGALRAARPHPNPFEMCWHSCNFSVVQK